jgi:hypothetical protein
LNRLRKLGTTGLLRRNWRPGAESVRWRAYEAIE